MSASRSIVLRCLFRSICENRRESCWIVCAVVVISRRFTVSGISVNCRCQITRSRSCICLARGECCDGRIKAPRSRASQHHDAQPDAIKSFRDVEQVTEPIRAIKWPPGTYPFDGVECQRPGTNHEKPERRQDGQ